MRGSERQNRASSSTLEPSPRVPPASGTDAPAPARVTLPSDLPGSLKYLDDAQLQRLSKAVAVKINRRNPAPKNEIAPAAPSEERCASNARGGIAASADATNTTPPTTIFVTFVDPNSGQGGVLTVPAF